MEYVLLRYVDWLCCPGGITVTEDEKEAFRARSKERFARYTDEVVRMLKGRSDFLETVSKDAISEAWAELMDEDAVPEEGEQQAEGF